MTSQNSTRELVDERCAWHWIGIGIDHSQGCLDQIQRVYLKRGLASLHGRNDVPELIVSATRSFAEMYRRTVKPGPTTFLKRINYRHMLYILKGIIELPSAYYRSKKSVAFIWMHEICGTVFDRYTDPSE